MKIKKPEIVFFDLDNTLYNYNTSHAAALTHLKLKVKTLLNINSDEFDVLYLKAKKIVKSQLGSTASSHSRLLYFQKLIELRGLGSQPLMALDFEQTYWNNFLSNAELCDGVIEVFDEFRLNGVKIGLITDLTSTIQFRKIIFFGLDHFFDCIVTSEEIGQDKPNKDCFLNATKKLGITSIEQTNIWMIGDDELKDLEGAKNVLNANTLHFNRFVSKRKSSLKFDFVFDDYNSLLKLIKNVFN